MDSRALSTGTVVHRRYRIERTLGEGGFGVTYLVTDLKEGTTAAMKEYMPLDTAYRRGNSAEVLPHAGRKEDYERFRTRFLEEARIIYRFRGHPNIVRVMHLFYENNTAYYVMEFIQGMDLGKLLEKNGQRLPWQTLRPIFAQAVAALAEVHRSGMIHCDISPDNIFVLDGGQVKLIDFGAAKSVSKEKASVMLLKRGYAPPEQLTANGRLGPWTDVYALAVTLYRCMTGKLPPNAGERLTADHTVWPSQLGAVVPSAGWEMALRKAMALRVEHRYQSIEQFWQELAGQISPLSNYTKSAYCSQPTRNAQPSRPLRILLVGKAGIYAGRQIPVQPEQTLFGSERGRCQVLFPAGTPGVGRVHMRVWLDQGRPMVMDMGSGFPTQIISGGKGKPLSPGLVYALPPDATIIIGSQSFCLMAESG